MAVHAVRAVPSRQPTPRKPQHPRHHWCRYRGELHPGCAVFEFQATREGYECCVRLPEVYRHRFVQQWWICERRLRLCRDRSRENDIGPTTNKLAPVQT